ncbi:MAG: ABC transporter ATP-binding protein/permease [Cellvibrionaceae bacterium]|nr:ABC transporter ATP-binding protein/permease [Cellvibrionaceae bacterium]
MLNNISSICPVKESELYRSIGLAFVEGCLMAAPYYLLIVFFQQLLAEEISYTNASIFFVILFLLLSLRIIVTRYNMTYTTSVAYGRCSQLRLDVAEYLFRVPMSFFSRYSTSDISYRMNKDIAFTENIFAHFFSQLVSCITVIGLLSLLFFLLDWRLAICLLCGMPLAVLAQSLLKKGANKLSTILHQEMNKTNVVVMDFVQGIREHKLSGNDQQSLDRLKQRIHHTKNIALKHELRVGFVPILFSILPELGFGFFLLVSLYFYQDGQLSLASFAIFLIASARLYLCLGQLAIVMAESRFMEQAAMRVKLLLSDKILNVGSNNETLSGNVLVNNLSFAYPSVTDASMSDEPQTRVLDNISFSAKPGSLTAIVGVSGVGKTTLLQLLARYHQVNDDAICLDDNSINQLSDRCLYGQIALVSQDIQLFDTTIMENLLMAGKNLSKQDVYRACKLACCDSFIRQLPKGYESQAGEAGAYLSGGEQQRLSLARALLIDAKILLLDEITSALDVKNELSILQLLNRLKKEKTLIMITHSQCLAMDADQVIMLRRQNQPLIGKHKKLFEENNEYRSLWGSNDY